MVSSGVSLTLWTEGVSLALVGCPCSDGITVKILYGVDVLLHRPSSHPIFSYWVKTKSDFIVISFETDLGRSPPVVAVINVDSYPFLAFSA